VIGSKVNFKLYKVLASALKFDVFGAFLELLSSKLQWERSYQLSYMGRICWQATLATTNIDRAHLY
jgi:hypothetical protein